MDINYPILHSPKDKGSWLSSEKFVELLTLRSLEDPSVVLFKSLSDSDKNLFYENY